MFGPLGGVLGRFFIVLGGLRGIFGGPWGGLGRLLGHLGGVLGGLGAVLGRLGPVLACLETVLGRHVSLEAVLGALRWGAGVGQNRSGVTPADVSELFQNR